MTSDNKDNIHRSPPDRTNGELKMTTDDTLLACVNVIYIDSSIYSTEIHIQ